MPSTLMIWWSVLCAAATINTVLCVLAAWQVSRRQASMPAHLHAMRVRLLWLAAIYAVGCGFRSVFPMIDVPRVCLHDTWVSRIIIGRSVATIAELAFALQLSLWLRAASEAAGARLAATASLLIVPIIGVAELLSWVAVLRQNYLMHAVENSLWTLMAGTMIAILICLRFQALGRHRQFIGIAILCATAYVAYMVFVDVPMYVSRWHVDLAAHHPYLALGAGFREILQRCTVIREWSAWRLDVPWLSLYFTVAVWISIALAYAAPVGGASRPDNVADAGIHD